MKFVPLTLALFTILATGATAAPHRRVARSPHHPIAASTHRLLTPSSSLPLDPPPIMPLSQVRVGMKGYGLTTFHGTKIDRFGIEVLGILPNYYMGQPLILVRMTGGPMSTRGAYLIHGMSGSPCYIDGRLMGAFSMGEALAKEPIGMVTPIEPMLEALDPRLPDRPAGVSEAEFGAGSPDTTSAVYPRLDATSGYGLLDAPSAPELAALGALQPDSPVTPVMVSGLGSRAFRMFANGLRPFRLAAMPAPGAMKNYSKPISLQPGSAIGIQLISGDIDAAAFGTVTYRRGNRLLAFGHPFFGIGPTNFPLTTAFVHEIFPGLSASHWYASSVKPVGEMVQDRPYSVACRLGPLPPMIPLECAVDDRSTGRKRVFHARVVNHPLLAPVLIPSAIDEAIFEVHPVPGDATATVTTEVVTDGFGTIRRENQVFDPVAIDVAALEDLTQAVDVLSRNRFQRVPIKALNVHVTIEAKRHTASIDRIFVRQDKFEPGETVDVGVVLRPFRGEPFTTTAQVKIPEYADNGHAVLMVSGGPARQSAPAVVIVGGGGAAPAAGPAVGGTPNASSVAQLLQQYLGKEKNNQLVTRIVFATPAVSVAGTPLSELPSTLADIMRSSKSTGLRTERDEVKSVADLDWLVSGAQSLPITIERKDQSEKRAIESGTAKQSQGTSVAEATTTFAQPPTVNAAEEESAQVEPRAAVRPEPTAVRPLAAPTQKTGRRSHKSAGSGSTTGSDNSAPAAAAPDTESAKSEDANSNAKLVGRLAVRWTQSSQADFERGTMQAVGVSSAGDIRLAPRLRPLHETTEPYIWSLCAGDGVTYAGTGNGGLVYRVKPDGDTSLYFKTGELEVHALARDKQGNVYAGTSPNGKVYRISPDGQGKLLFALNPDGEPLRVPAPPARFVLSLAVADDGSVYAGTGPDGRIYRITPDGQSSLFFQSPDHYVLSLLTAGEKLYAGTADSGLVYEISRAGAAHCIYDSDEKAITALARDAQGRLYAASAPKGIIYRIAPGGAVTTVWEKSKGPIYALAAAPAGELYAACGNVIYRVGTNDRVTILSDSHRAQFVALAVQGEGRLIAGSANVGTLYALEAASEGTFESAVHDAKTVSRWGQIRWDASMPEGSRLQFETRSGHSPEPDATWSPWAPVEESGSGNYISSSPARFIQYRVKLSAASASPVLRQVVISYLPRNQAPSVALTTPAAGEFWRGAHEIKWSGSDPDKDTLTYELFFSGDNGKSWKPIGERVQSPARPTAPLRHRSGSTPAADPQAIAHALADNPALARFREDLAAAPGLSDADRRQALQQADEMIARLDADEDEDTAGPGASRPAAAAAGPAEPGTTRDSSLHWDTTAVPDGTYLIKVVASDRVSNPADPLSAEVVSNPVVIANRPPHLVCFSRAVAVGADRKALVAGVAESRVPLQGAQYRIDGGDWIAIVPSDGIWDGKFEPWSLTTPVLTSGKHQLEVKLVDVAGNVTTQMVPVEVP